jgi:hypothetical protein
MFLTDSNTNELPQIILLPGAQPYKTPEVTPQLDEPFVSVYPDSIELPNLWDKSIPDLIPPDLGNDDLGEKVDWNEDEVNPAHFLAKPFISWQMNVSSKTTAQSTGATDAMGIGYSMSVQERITLIEMEPVTVAAQIGYQMDVSEETTAKITQVAPERVDIGFELTVSEST